MKSSISATYEVYQVWSYLNREFPIMAHYYMRGAMAAATDLEKYWLVQFMDADEYKTFKQQGF
jgi:hypothetical protein